MGYALRHVGDFEVAAREFFRVLKPGGTVCVLEITRPQGRFKSLLLKMYMRGVIPALSWVVARSRDTPTFMRYYWDTSKPACRLNACLQALAHAGFASVKRHVEVGIFSEYRGIKPK